jgi:hypothetical protein
MLYADMTGAADKFRRKRNMKPECVAEYNAFIYGVDSADQYLTLHPITRKIVKLPKKEFFYLLHCTSLTHSAISKRKLTKKRMEYLDFMKIVS